MLDVLSAKAEGLAALCLLTGTRPSQAQIDDLVQAAAEYIEDGIRTNRLDGYLSLLQGFADTFGADVDFYDLTDTDEVLEFNEHFLNIIFDEAPRQDQATYKEQIEEAFAATLAGRYTSPYSQEDFLDRAHRLFGDEGDESDPLLDGISDVLDEIREEAIAWAVEKNGKMHREDIERNGLAQALERMNATAGKAGEVDFSDFSVDEAVKFTELLVTLALEDPEGEVSDLIHDAYVLVIDERTAKPGDVAAAFGIDGIETDVSDEFYRIYYYLNDKGIRYSASVLNPLTLVIGEDGEHIFTLQNNTRQIMPPDFVHLDIFYHDETDVVA